MIEINADIVLNGAPSWHDGDSDYMRWCVMVHVYTTPVPPLHTLPLHIPPLQTPQLHIPPLCRTPSRSPHADRNALIGDVTLTHCTVRPAAPDWQYGKAYPPHSIVITGNTHAPQTNGSAILAISGEGIVLSANEMGSRTPQAANTGVALVEVGSDSALFGVTNLQMAANTGFSAAAGAMPLPLSNYGLVRIRASSKPSHGSVGMHTWSNADSSPLLRPRNLLGELDYASWATQCTVAKQATTFNGNAVWGIGKLPRAATSRTAGASDACMTTMLSVDLAATPELAGQVVYIVAQVNVLLPTTGVSLLIDAGDGVLQSSSDSYQEPGWHLAAFQMAMKTSGTARFGINVFSTAAKGRVGAAIEVAHAVVAPVGQEWSRL